MEETLSAAKKITPGRKSKKAQLAEVVPIQEKTEVLPEEPVEMPEEPAVDLSGLAQSLTRPQGLTDAEVEARLAPAPEAAGTPESGGAQCPPEPGTGTAGRDMSRIALFLSAAAIILLLGFFLHLNRNLKALTMQVQDLSAIKSTVTTLDTKIGTMETKVADLETLPAKTRAALLSSILQEMSQKTSYMSTQLESPEQQDKLMRAKELIQQVQTELNAGN